MITVLPKRPNFLDLRFCCNRQTHLFSSERTRMAFSVILQSEFDGRQHTVNMGVNHGWSSLIVCFVHVWHDGGRNWSKECRYGKNQVQSVNLMISANHLVVVSILRQSGTLESISSVKFLEVIRMRQRFLWPESGTGTSIRGRNTVVLRFGSENTIPPRRSCQVAGNLTCSSNKLNGR